MHQVDRDWVGLIVLQDEPEVPRGHRPRNLVGEQSSGLPHTTRPISPTFRRHECGVWQRADVDGQVDVSIMWSESVS